MPETTEQIEKSLAERSFNYSTRELFELVTGLRAVVQSFVALGTLQSIHSNEVREDLGNQATKVLDVDVSRLRQSLFSEWQFWCHKSDEI